MLRILTLKNNAIKHYEIVAQNWVELALACCVQKLTMTLAGNVFRHVTTAPKTDISIVSAASAHPWSIGDEH